MLACAEGCLRRMDKVKIKTHNSKQAAALGIIAGRSGNAGADVDVIKKGGANGFSTFYGYYMLEALAATGHKDEAIKLISDYWGAMLDLGATTFWEDLKYSDVANAAPIDNFVPAHKYDIHAGGGAYCYKGLRLSLCHGWASGPTAWCRVMCWACVRWSPDVPLSKSILISVIWNGPKVLSPPLTAL